MTDKLKRGWKTDIKNIPLIVGIQEKPTQFETGQVIVNKKATKKNLERLIEINNDGISNPPKSKVTNDATDGGLLKGKPHYDKLGKPTGGIPGLVDNSKPIETEGEEFVLSKEASEKHWKELSDINTSTGGVPINPPNYVDENPETYAEGGNVIEFNPNHVPSKRILNYANNIRKNHPEIWKLGGNIFGNQAFKNLMAVSKRGYWLESEEWMYIKWRSYVARHIHDFRIEGVVAMLKWVDTVEKGWAYMKDLIEQEIEKREKRNSDKMAQGGVITYKDKYNKKYGYKKDESHSLKQISKDTGFSMKGLQQIYNKGIGAYKTNPESVRPNVKSKEQWAMARVYSAVMGGDASIVDKNELKMAQGGGIIPASGMLTTKDKKNKLDYKKVGDNYEFVVYDGEANPVENYTRVQYKKRDKNKVLMNYNQFVNYLYSEGYIDDKMAQGGLMSTQPPTENQLWNQLVNHYADGGNLNENLKEVKVLDKIYHKSNPMFRESILKEGLIPKGKSETWLSDTQIEGKVIFATNTSDMNDLFDSGYDDDIYEIDTTRLNNKWYSDPNFSWSDEYNHVITFDSIPLSAIKLVYEGTGKSLDEYENGGNTKNEIMNKNTDAKDTLTVDIPLMIRMLELSREDIHSDAELHQVVERLLDLKNKSVLTMDDYAYIADIEHKHINKMALGGTLETDPQKLISKAHYNLTVKRGRKEYAPSAYEIQEEIDRMVMEGQFGSNNI